MVWRGLIVIALLTVPARVTSDEGWFWHVTDIHYDSTYRGRQLSCQGHSVDVDNGAYGDYWCDSPWALVNNTVHAMAKIRQDVDFIMWTGDTGGHLSDADLTYALMAEMLDNVTSAIADAFPGKQMYPTFGNHDYSPANQFPPHNNDLYNETLYNRWNAWIRGEAQDENFRRGGYYTMVTSHGLRIVALNTNLYYKTNKQVANITDPAGQFDWLNKTLANASANHEKVILTAHIPPGVHTPNVVQWFYDDFNTRMLDILQTHADVISAMHFGHEHADGFRILLDKAGLPGSPMFMAPSVTPWRYDRNHNPAVRLIKYDRESGKTAAILQYYLDLPRANQYGGLAWELEYDTYMSYGLSELTATSLVQLVETMKNPESQEFKNYFNYFTVSGANNPACDESCHAGIICGFTHLHMDSLKQCKSTRISAATTLRASSHSRAVSVVGVLAVLFYF